MAQIKTLARKYARGLYKACQPQDLNAVRDLLSAVAELTANEPTVGLILKNPAVSEVNKADVLVALVEKFASDSGALNVGRNLVSNLMRVLVENKRTEAINEVAHSFTEIVAQHFKMSQIEIVSARALDQDECATYESALRQQLAQQTKVAFTVNPELLGGMQVKAGDTVIDGSVSHSLQQLRAALL